MINETLVSIYTSFTSTFFMRDSHHEAELTYEETLGLSWIFHFIYAFYTLFACWLSVVITHRLIENHPTIKLISTSLTISLQKVILFSTIVEVILYPFLFHLGYRFLRFILNFYQEIFLGTESDSKKREKSESITKSLFLANIFLLIPVFGNLLSFLAQIFLLYKSLVKKLNFTNLQAFVVLMTPLFIIFLVLVLLISYLIFIFSLI